MSPAAITICRTNDNAPVPGTIIAGISATVVGRSIPTIVRRGIATIVGRGIASIVRRGIAAIAIPRSTIVTVTGPIGVRA